MDIIGELFSNQVIYLGARSLSDDGVSIQISTYHSLDEFSMEFNVVTNYNEETHETPEEGYESILEFIDNKKTVFILTDIREIKFSYTGERTLSPLENQQ